MVHSMSPMWGRMTEHVDPSTQFSGCRVNQGMVNSMSPRGRE